MLNRNKFTAYCIFAVLIFCLLPVTAQETAAEDPLVAAFRENFTRAGDETKLDILKDSVNYSAELMGPLYKQAVDYAVNNSDQLRANVQLQEISLLAVQLAGTSSYIPAGGSLWDLFENYDETRVRVAILEALGRDKLGNERILNLINRWIDRQITVFRAGGGVNLQVLSRGIQTLGSFRDPSSFGSLLTLSVMGLPDDVTGKAREALLSIEGDYALMSTEVIRNSSPAEKLVALQTAVAREELTKEARAEVCLIALGVGNGLTLSDPANADLIRQLRVLSARTLRGLRWADATGELIRHFDLCVLEYDRGVGTKSALLEAIAALGVMDTREAAVRLALYLDVINSFVEGNQGYDEQIALGVVRSLGELKSKAGLNALLYLGYLDYSKTIRTAGDEARRAILGQ